MTFLLKITYYALLVCSTLIGVFYLGATLLGFLEQTSNAKIRENTIMIVACAVALALLYKAYQTGHVQGHWGPGAGIVFGAMLAFIVIFLGGMLLFGKLHWQ